MLNTQRIKINFLIACSQKTQSSQSRKIIEATLNKPENELRDILLLAYQHGVIPLVYHNIKNYKTLSDINRLKQSYREIATNNMLMSIELIKTMNIFSQHKIPALAFKGPALAKMAYGDIALRQFGDLDILIQQKDLTKVIKLLQQRNYSLDIELQEKEEKEFFSSVNVVGLTDKEKNISIEIHWKLTAQNYAIFWDQSKIWEQIDEVVIQKYPIATLSFVNHLLYLCVHGAKHLYERLEWLCDIDRLIRTNAAIEWKELIKAAQKLKIVRTLLLSLALCESILDLKIDDSIKIKIDQDKSLKKLKQKIIILSFSDSLQKPSAYQKFILLYSMRDTLYDKVSFVYFSLFSPKFDDYKTFKLPKYLTPLYPILRIMRLVKKYFLS